MKDLHRDSINFGETKISKLFFRLFFPTLTGLLFNALLNVADGIFVGHGVGSDALAAINIIAPLFMVTTGIGLMFGIGASVVASVHLSKGNTKAANINFTQAMLVSSLLMLAILLFGFCAPRTVAVWLGSSERLLPYATDYLVHLLPGCLFILFQSIGMLLIRLDGSPRYAMFCNVIPAVINILLDYIFVFPADMGVGGAALATTLSATVGGSMVIIYFLRYSSTLKFYRLKLSPTSFHLTVRNVGYMLKIGFSAFVAEIAMSVMMFTGNYIFLRNLGEDGVAAYSVACYLFPLVFMLNTAVAQSAQPIISFNYGAGNMARVRSARRTSLWVAAACGMAAMLFLVVFIHPVVALFLDSGTAAYKIAVAGIPVYATSSVFFALNIVFIGYYQSVEESVRATVYTLMRGIVLLVPAFFILPVLMGNIGIWLAIPCAELLTLVLIVAGHWMSKKK
ncbi:MAG: MATE family efflux transporter [Bacteroidaceae bacterium]|nr:MATE family efflux transporter [Bacteroidaceae bacterium]